MIVQEIKDYSKFIGLEEEWAILLGKSFLGTAFLSHKWFKCWWEAYGEGKELSVFLCREDGNLVAVSPLMTSKDYFRGFPIRKISFIENDETPHCGIFADSDAALSASIQALISHVTRCKRRWDILWLRKIPNDTTIPQKIERCLEEKGYRYITRESLKSPVLRIETDWDAFYSGTNQRFKKKIRYDNNKLKRQGHLTVEEMQEPDEIIAAMEEVFQVGASSWKGKTGKSIGSTYQNRLFFSALPKDLATKGTNVSLWSLRLEGKMIAFEYHIRQNDIVYALRGEFDEDYRDCAPGSVLDFEVVRGLFDKNTRLYNMCGSSDEYKLRWTRECQSHLDILVFNSRPYSTFLAFLEEKVKVIVGKTFRVRPHTSPFWSKGR